MGGLESTCGDDDFFRCGEDESDAAEIANIDLHARRSFSVIKDDTLGQGGLVDYQIWTREAVLAEEGSFGGVPF